MAKVIVMFLVLALQRGSVLVAAIAFACDTPNCRSYRANRERGVITRSFPNAAAITSFVLIVEYS